MKKLSSLFWVCGGTENVGNPQSADAGASLHRRVCYRNTSDSTHITSMKLLSEENRIALLQYNHQPLH